MAGFRAIALVLYTLSGAAGLVYEVAWTRLLTLELGHTVAAASTVLAAFMGGLALGAGLAGRFTPPAPHRALRTYAVLELSIAATALLLPVALTAVFPVLAWAYADGTAGLRVGLVRVAISFILVGVPATAMGATFPIIASAVASSARDAGALYAVNAGGAAAGAIAAGFWLVPAVGLRATTWAGVVLNGLAAAGAFWLARRTTVPLSPARRVSSGPRSAGSAESDDYAPRLAAAAAAISGCAALVYEVAWTRLIALVVGPTTYAFATMAASFITGIAAGSAVGTRLARRAGRPAQWLALTLIGGAVASAAASWYAATRMPIAVAVQVASPSADFSSIVWHQAILLGLLLLPTTAALGAAFPLALALASRPDSDVARDTARVYAANTLGAIGGSLAAGFVLIPAFGLRATIRDMAVGAAIAGAALLARARSGESRSAHAFARHESKAIALQGKSAKAIALQGRAAKPFPRTTDGSRRKDEPATTAIGPAALAALAAAVALAIAFVPPWDRALLASGAYKYAPYIGGADLDAVLRAGTLVYYKEGAAGTVSVRDLNGTRSLSIDGKVDASNAGDMLTQRLLGLLPVLIHGRAQEIAVIGLGSGVTVASALAAGGVRHADVVEISPEVVEASRLFDKENGRVLERPDVRLIVGDGRSHLLLTPKRYDVIVSEPSNPWMAGVATLFTREFFEAARTRLRPGGLLCQWAHTYDIQPDDLRSIVATFASVFPQGSMWLVGGGDLLLIGAADGEFVARLGGFQQRAQRPAVDAVLGDVGATAGTAYFVLASMYAGGPEELARFAGDSAIQTDDLLPLEYSAPRGIYGRTKADNADAIRAIAVDRPAAIRAAFEAADADAWASRGAVDLRAQAFSTAYGAFREAVARNSRHVGALAGLSDAAGGANKLSEERQLLEAIAAREADNAPARIELSRVRAVLGDGTGAVDAASEALRIAPDDPHAAEQLAAVFADLNDRERLSSLSEAMMARFPNRPDPVYYRATALYLNGQTEAAIALARRVVAAHPAHARAQGLLGAACAAANQRDCAREAFDAAIRANPRDPSPYINAGALRLQIADPSAAMSYFANALAIDPTSAAARDGLAQARAQIGTR
jgi:spermidine synthase